MASALAKKSSVPKLPDLNASQPRCCPSASNASVHGTPGSISGPMLSAAAPSAETIAPEVSPPAAIIRSAPSGPAFPACVACNHSTSVIEQALGMLTRFGTHVPTKEDEREFLALLQAVQNNSPTLQPDMWMRPIEKRKAFKQLGARKPDGMAWADVPVVQFPPSARFAVMVLGFKVGCALYYKHVGRPLLADGCVQNDLLAKATLMLHGVPKLIRELAVHKPVLKRSGKDLSRQFDYRYNMNTERGYGLFACMFRDSFAMNVVTVESLSRSGITDDGGWTRVDGFLSNLPSEWDAFLARQELAKTG
jgi:hypothetical protein